GEVVDSAQVRRRVGEDGSDYPGDISAVATGERPLQPPPQRQRPAKPPHARPRGGPWREPQARDQGAGRSQFARPRRVCRRPRLRGLLRYRPCLPPPRVGGDVVLLFISYLHLVV